MGNLDGGTSISASVHLFLNIDNYGTGVIKAGICPEH